MADGLHELHMIHVWPMPQLEGHWEETPRIGSTGLRWRKAHCVAKTALDQREPEHAHQRKKGTTDQSTSARAKAMEISGHNNPDHKDHQT